MSEVLEWQDGQNLIKKMRFVGLTPIVINDGVHFATNVLIEQEREIQNIGTNSVISASDARGEMMLFSQPGMPMGAWNGKGVPQPTTIKLIADDKALRFEDVLFPKRKMLPGYEKCEAAYVEWIASNMSMVEITKSINTRITI